MSIKTLSDKFLHLYSELTKLQREAQEKQELLNGVAKEMQMQIPVSNVTMMIDNEYIIKLDNNGNYTAEPIYEVNKSDL